MNDRRAAGQARRATTRRTTIPDAIDTEEINLEDLVPEPECIDFEIGDSVVCPTRT